MCVYVCVCMCVCVCMRMHKCVCACMCVCVCVCVYVHVVRCMYGRTLYSTSTRLLTQQRQLGNYQPVDR